MHILLTSITKRKIIWKTAIRSKSVIKNVSENRHVKSFEEIPGPSRLPIIGQLANFLPGGSLYKRDNFWKDLNQMHGPIVKLEGLFTPSVVALFDESAIEEVYRKENGFPIRTGTEPIEYYRKFYSQIVTAEHLGLSVDSGEAWKKLRSLLNPIMLNLDHLGKYTDSIEEINEDMIKRLKFLRQENNMIPKFYEELHLWSFEANAFIAIGMRLNCLDLLKHVDDDTPEFKLIRYMSDLFDLLGALNKIEFFWKNFPNKKFREFKYKARFVEQLTAEYIHKATKIIKHNANTNDIESVLKIMLNKNEDLAVILSADIFFGGIVTIAAITKNIMYFLAKHPEAQQKIRTLPIEERKKYLKAVMKESMRMLPPTSIHNRITTKEYNLLGYRIPKNTTLIFIYENMAEKNYYRHNEFIPERWLIHNKDDPLSHKNAHPFSFIPFGFGIRSCLGRRFAEFVSEMFLARLVENFNIKWIGPPPEIIHNGIHSHIKTTNFVMDDVKTME